ncbi:hypothetical protein SAMN05192566_0730 [Methylophilus rhizosphaerae]|uniref:Uncharacterized protein n=1 Tax=Methylophilus rhizosphaerae TaxID=492660 RepID=A0A1G9A7J3_9PROT|nr:hypothetical protein [Methylophilus rhizosphaerae]SDK23277.1 hypothetical protein SAMN05192566_0730 [Methylophilus rhizosphaerae]
MDNDFAKELELFDDMDAYFDNKISNESDRSELRKFYNESGARDNEHINTQFKLWILQSNVLNETREMMNSFDKRFYDTVAEKLATTENVLNLFKDNLLTETDNTIKNHMETATNMSNQIAIRTNDCIIEVNQAFTEFNSILADKSSEFTSYIESQMSVIRNELDGKKMAQIATTELITTATMEMFPKIFRSVSKSELANFTEDMKNVWSKKRIVREIIVMSSSIFIGGGLLFMVSRFF